MGSEEAVDESSELVLKKFDYISTSELSDEKVLVPSLVLTHSFSVVDY